MREFDIAVSLGFSCDTAQALGLAELQDVSCPLDGLYVPSLQVGARLLAGGFDGWLCSAEDLELLDMRHTDGSVSRFYRNRNNGCVLLHDFDGDNTLERAFESVRADYAHRISRLQEALASARRILCFYLEDPRKPRRDDDVLCVARQRIADRWKDAEVTLLYVHSHPDGPAAAERLVAPGVLSVGLEYRTWVRGEVSSVTDLRSVVRYLREGFRLSIRRTKTGRPLKSEVRGYDRVLFGVYRKLGRYLKGQGLVPPDRPGVLIESAD